MANRFISLIAKLGIDGSGFQRGLHDAESEFQRFGGSIKNKLAGMFGATAMTAFMRSVIQTASNIQDMAEQFGITTDEMQRMEKAAEQSGLRFEDMGKALLKINDLREKALRGDADAIEHAQRLGIAFSEITNQDVSGLALLEKAGNALSDVNLDHTTAMALKEIFGSKRGERLVQALRDLSTIKPPAIFDKETISVLDQVERKTANVWKMIKSMAGGAIAGWASIFGIKPQSAGGSTDANPFTGMSDNDLLEHIRLLEAAQAEREKIVGGAFKSGMPGYGGKAMTLLGTNPDLANSFKEDEAMLKALQDEMARRGASKLQPKADGQARLDRLKDEQRVMEKIFDLQLGIADATEKRAMLQREIDAANLRAAQALEAGDQKLATSETMRALELQAKLNGIQSKPLKDVRGDVGGMGARGMFTGMGVERAFALLGGSPEAKQTAENTKLTAELTRQVVQNTAQRANGDPLGL